MTVRHTTIAIPKHRSDLFDSVSGSYLSTQCARYDRGRLIDPVRGMVWCFVEANTGEDRAIDLCRQLRDHPRGDLFFITAVLDGVGVSPSELAARAGADECIPGPLTPQALSARIERRGVKRVEAGGGDILEIGDYTVDLATQRMFWTGKLLALRPSEFKLFTALLRSRNRLMSLEEIIAISGTAPGTIKKRTVHVWMGRLRRILNEQGIGEHIRSVRSMGYVFDYPDHGSLLGHEPETIGNRPLVRSGVEKQVLA